MIATAKNIIVKKTYSPGKADYMGRGRRDCRVTIEYELLQGEHGPVFSACGNVWNDIGSDCYSCGQNIDAIVRLFPHNKRVKRIAEIWTQYHLNDMNAGCEHQRANWDLSKKVEIEKYGRKEMKLVSWIYPTEHPDGLLMKPCEVCGYAYGSAWLYSPIPDEIIAEIKSW